MIVSLENVMQCINVTLQTNCAISKSNEHRTNRKTIILGTQAIIIRYLNKTHFIPQGTSM